MRNSIALLAVVLSGAVACSPQEPAGRYLYVISCDARVDKLDTVKDLKTNVYTLAERTAKERVVPAMEGTLDGCLAYQTLYDAKSSIFYAVVPVQANAKANGTRDYRVLGFSVPGLQLVKQQPAGTNLSDPPHLDALGGEGVRVMPSSEWKPQTDLDLAEFAPDKKPLRNQILESSGASVLLRIFTADAGELALAVADRRSKTLVHLRDVVPTVAPDVHLTPGGEAVLVEGAERNATRPAKDGKLALYDAHTGVRIREWSDPQVQKLHFLAISPTGKAVYHAGETYGFVDLQRKFVTDAVSRPLGPGYPGVFFADR